MHTLRARALRPCIPIRYLALQEIVVRIVFAPEVGPPTMSEIEVRILARARPSATGREGWRGWRQVRWTRRRSRCRAALVNLNCVRAGERTGIVDAVCVRAAACATVTVILDCVVGATKGSFVVDSGPPAIVDRWVSIIDINLLGTPPSGLFKLELILSR